MSRRGQSPQRSLWSPWRKVLRVPVVPAAPLRPALHARGAERNGKRFSTSSGGAQETRPWRGCMGSLPAKLRRGSRTTPVFRSVG
eukprot:1613014-Pyramimonas_sp.AAC.1